MIDRIKPPTRSDEQEPRESTPPHTEHVSVDGVFEPDFDVHEYVIALSPIRMNYTYIDANLKLRVILALMLANENVKTQKVGNMFGIGNLNYYLRKYSRRIAATHHATQDPRTDPGDTRAGIREHFVKAYTDAEILAQVGITPATIQSIQTIASRMTLRTTKRRGINMSTP